MLRSYIQVPVLQRLLPWAKRNFSNTKQFETVFSCPSIKYIALFNRLKVYQLFGASIIVPSCGVMELANIIPDFTFFTASYIGLTGAALLSLASIPFKNIIGFLYISDDNTSIKISSVDFWGKRKDTIVKADDWVPLLDLAPRTLDAVYLEPRLSDGTKYKLFLKFGNVLNEKKFGEVFE